MTDANKVMAGGLYQGHFKQGAAVLKRFHEFVYRVPLLPKRPHLADAYENRPVSIMSEYPRFISRAASEGPRNREDRLDYRVELKADPNGYGRVRVLAVPNQYTQAQGERVIAERRVKWEVLYDSWMCAQAVRELLRDLTAEGYWQYLRMVA